MSDSMQSTLGTEIYFKKSDAIQQNQHMEFIQTRMQHKILNKILNSTHNQTTDSVTVTLCGTVRQCSAAQISSG